MSASKLALDNVQLSKNSKEKNNSVHIEKEQINKIKA